MLIDGGVSLDVYSPLCRETVTKTLIEFVDFAQASIFVLICEWFLSRYFVVSRCCFFQIIESCIAI